MGYAELILTLQQLPEEKQAEVLDFARFLAQQDKVPQENQPKTLADSPLAALMREPMSVQNFKPMSREEANAR